MSHGGTEISDHETNRRYVVRCCCGEVPIDEITGAGQHRLWAGSALVLGIEA